MAPEYGKQHSACYLARKVDVNYCNSDPERRIRKYWKGHGKSFFDLKMPVCCIYVAYTSRQTRQQDPSE